MLNLLRPARKSRGQALVEFAFVVLPLFTLICGTFDLGRAVFTYNTLAESARQGNRFAIVDQRIADVKATAIQYAPTLGMTGSDVAVCFKTPNTTQVDCSKPTTDDCSADLKVGCLAIVTTTVRYHPFTPFVGAIWPSGVTISSTSIGSIEYVCPTSTKANCP